MPVGSAGPPHARGDFLAALLVTTRFVILWDVLSVKLGGTPHETIPLFRWLPPSQEGVATLTGVLKTVDQGQKTVSRGDAGEEIYVIMRGTAEARRLVQPSRRRAVRS